jgi:hypothetical protein
MLFERSENNKLMCLCLNFSKEENEAFAKRISASLATSKTKTAVELEEEKKRKMESQARSDLERKMREERQLSLLSIKDQTESFVNLTEPLMYRESMRDSYRRNFSKFREEQEKLRNFLKEEREKTSASSSKNKKRKTMSSSSSSSSSSLDKKLTGKKKTKKKMSMFERFVQQELEKSMKELKKRRQAENGNSEGTQDDENDKEDEEENNEENNEEKETTTSSNSSVKDDSMTEFLRQVVRWSPSAILFMSQKRALNTTASNGAFVPSEEDFNFEAIAQWFAFIVQRTGFCYQGDESVMHILTKFSPLFLALKLGFIALSGGSYACTTPIYDLNDSTVNFIVLYRSGDGDAGHWRTIGYDFTGDKKDKTRIVTVLNSNSMPQIFRLLNNLDCNQDEARARSKLESARMAYEAISHAEL